MRRERLGWLWVALGGCLVFLYLPIVTVVVMSFNSGRSALNLTGLSLRWYGELFDDGDLGRGAGQLAARGLRRAWSSRPCWAPCSPSAWCGSPGRRRSTRS